MNVVVTSGGTVAPIDDVRQLTNTSTGRTGAAIAEAALARGAHVWYAHTPLAALPFEWRARVDLNADFETELSRIQRLGESWQAVRARCHLVPLAVGTVPEYAEALRQTLLDRPIDVTILAMAASDFAPEPVQGKLDSSVNTLTLQCRRLPKVIRSVRDWSPTTYLVGFKLLSGVPESRLIEAASAACSENRADLTVANDLATLKAGRHVLHLVRPGRVVETIGPDPRLADVLVDRVFGWVGAGSNG